MLTGDTDVTSGEASVAGYRYIKFIQKNGPWITEHKICSGLHRMEFIQKIENFALSLSCTQFQMSENQKQFTE